MDVKKNVNEYFSYFMEWDAAYADYARAVGLSFTSLCVLEHIYESESCTQKMLCDHCHLPKQTVNAAVTALYKKGQVRLTELPEDRRNKLITFTDAGKSFAEEVLLPLRICEQRAMQALSQSEQTMLLSATKRYISVCREEMAHAKKQ